MMRTNLTLLLIVVGLVGCATSPYIDPTTPEARAILAEFRAERLARDASLRVANAGRNEQRDNYQYCMTEFKSEYDLRIQCIAEVSNKGLSVTRAEMQEVKKEQILAGLKQRCDEYGFTGDANISACIQREAQHDKELALQRLELQRAYAQNVTEPVPEEEELPFLIKFLGDVAIGVAENLADPAFHRDVQQQKQINQLKANQNRDIYRNCRPNC